MCVCARVCVCAFFLYALNLENKCISRMCKLLRPVRVRRCKSPLLSLLICAILFSRPLLTNITVRCLMSTVRCLVSTWCPWSPLLQGQCPHREATPGECSHEEQGHLCLVFSEVQFGSIQFKMVSMRSEKPICAPPRLSEFPPTLPLLFSEVNIVVNAVLLTT